ncbi:leukemia NUP98 fusion partner 1 [Callorhinchus milii]|uniref:leukemia NUP98 fusion partner 1 n=1 Tax=Callorhinchus milii TaxID=7868 RepID=UPI001C3FC3F0|nr:leukemia NUP98 fusion partner 1 [Callorhinchus milii]
MEQEEDEDIAFAKWMSSFWGHNLVDEGGKDVRARQRRQSKAPAERRASCPAQLSAVRMSQMHSTTKVPTPVSLKGFKEIRRDKEDRGHHLMKAKTNEPTLNSQEENKRSSVQTFTSTFQKHLKFRSRNTLSLDKEEDPCVICHDDLRTGYVRELHCMHRFHKECIGMWLWKKPTCPTCRVKVKIPNPFFWSSPKNEDPMTATF